MAERALERPDRIPRSTTVEEPPQLTPTPKIDTYDRPDRSDQEVGNRPEVDRTLRGERAGSTKSPYMHHLRQDPSRQRREDTEQRDEIERLKKQEKDDVDDRINEIRNQDTRINPYNVNAHVAETVESIIADLRNMEQAPWSGELSTQRGISPLHTLFDEQFSVSEEDNVTTFLTIEDIKNRRKVLVPGQSSHLHRDVRRPD